MANDIKTLLTGIRTRLNTQITTLAKKASSADYAIYIVKDENELPEEANFPCITIKDNGETWTDFANKRRETTKNITIYVYVTIYKNESGVISDSALSKKGVNEYIEEIKTALTDYSSYSGVTNLDYARSKEATATQVVEFVDKSQFALRRAINFDFIFEEFIS